MYDWLVPDFSHQNYYGFVRDLRKVATETKDGATDKPQQVSAARKALPRTAWYKGKNAPSARKLALAAVEARRTAELLRKLTDWTANRFDNGLYEALIKELCACEDSALAQVLFSVFFKGEGERVLDHSPKGCWLFNLPKSEANVAGIAYEEARSLAQHALSVVEKPPDWVWPLIKCYFFSDRKTEAKDLKGTQDLAPIAKVFRQTSIALEASQETVVLGPGDGRMGSGRTAIAYIDPRFPVGEGALIFLCPQFSRSSRTYGGKQELMEKGCTVLHEATHLFASTEDVVYNGNENNCYGRDNCFKLPHAMAVKNADSYGLFAFDAARYVLFKKHPDDVHKALDTALAYDDPLWELGDLGF
jgi:hypothetical protein